MNQNETLLDLELRLLVARHGKDRVVKTLSEIESIDHGATEVRRYKKKGNEWLLVGYESADRVTIENGVSAYEDGVKRNRAKRQSKESVEELVREISPSNPAVTPLLQKLARAYENKEFLPDLREVRRFLASRGKPTGIQSRRTALPTVLRVLAHCTVDELQAFDAEKRGSRSDLGIITDQILGHRDNAAKPA